MCSVSVVTMPLMALEFVKAVATVAQLRSVYTSSCGCGRGVRGYIGGVMAVGEFWCRVWCLRSRHFEGFWRVIVESVSDGAPRLEVVAVARQS